MDYKIKNNEKQSVEYVNSMINKIFAILGIYEDCVKKNEFSSYFSYIERICFEIKGCIYTTNFKDALSLYNTLVGLKNSEVVNHKNVKSTVFHCISLIKKNWM